MHDYPIFIFAALLIFGFGLFSRASKKYIWGQVFIINIYGEEG